MNLQDISAHGTQHCETSAIGVLMRSAGIDLSEPMLFGLGSGLGYVLWGGFVGGRVKPLNLTRNLAARLGLELSVKETVSPRKAWQNVLAELATGHPVGLQLDCYHLEYFTSKIHFGGHVVAIYGYDEQLAYLVDTEQQGGAVATSLESLAAARAQRGPMTARNLSFTLDGGTPDVAAAVGPAVRANAADFLAAPISNVGYRGIAKMATLVGKLSPQVGELMERGGTGGALFRNLYRDFLAECLTLVQDPALSAAHDMYVEIAPRWTDVAEAISTGSPEQAAQVLRDLAVRERVAMETLTNVRV